VTKDFFGDVHSHEVQCHFGDVLSASWNKGRTACGQCEQGDENDGCNDAHQVDAVELKGTEFDDGVRKELPDGGWVEPAFVTRRGEILSRRLDGQCNLPVVMAQGEHTTATSNAGCACPLWIARILSHDVDENHGPFREWQCQHPSRFAPFVMEFPSSSPTASRLWWW